VQDVIDLFPPGRAYLADQLRRASSSVPANIAEGAGELTKRDKARFYRIARRSATECAAHLDVCRTLERTDSSRYDACRSLLLRIVAMLVRMAVALRGQRRAGLRTAG